MAREDNAFNMRRFANIFAPQQDDPLMGAYRKIDFNRGSTTPGRAPSGPVSEEADNDPVSIAMKRLQGGQASNAYREHITKLPTREEYAPSQTRRIGGALAAAAAGFNDPKMGAYVGEQIINAPYRNAMESWQTKGAGLKEQADIEKDDATSQLNYVKAVRQQQVDAETQALARRKVDIDEEQAATNRMYREAQIGKMKTEGFREMTDPEGNVILYHPDGRQQNMGPSIEGRKVANQERATNISAYGAETGRINANTGIGNLNQRGVEFGQRQAQDEIANAARDRQLNISQQNADQSGMNAGSAGFVNAGEVFTANAMAAQEVARTNPKFKDWTIDANGMPARPGTLWGTNPVDPASPEAQEFLRAVETAKQGVLRTRRPGVGAPPRAPAGMGQGPIKFSDLPTGGGGLKF
jgi:hypothetical protein